MNTHPKLILGSSSPYRKELLLRLGLDFSTSSPEVDETAQLEEKPQQLVVRLAELKARTVGITHPGALIIGSDQVATLEGKILGKPGNYETAFEQLSFTAGKSVEFLTGLCLYNSANGKIQTHCEPFRVKFRPLSNEEIRSYLLREQPYNCAGSFKSEGLGIALFEAMEGEDPNALIGLPLIRLISMLRNEGINPLMEQG
jgi:MAF protein